MVIYKKFITQMPGLFGALCAGTISLTSALADDTEVFFGQGDPNVDPNVMFVLDTSSSMSNTDGTNISRLDRMKSALDALIENSTNINIGVMKYSGSNGGGAVLYPVTPIDQEICEQNSCGEQSISRSLSNDADDIEESVTSGNVDLNGSVLGLGVASGEAQVVGLRYTKVNIPQGATITSAFLQFQAHSDNSEPTNLSIAGHLTDDAPPFSSDDFATASLPTTNHVDWVPEDWLQDNDYNSEDLSEVMQEIVDRPGWCGGQSVAMIVTGTGYRAAKSFDQSQGVAPTLKYTYDSSSIPDGGGCISKTHISSVATTTDDAEERLSNGNVNTSSSDLELPYENGSSNQLIGIRFTGINIPKNALITDARLEFEIDQTKSGYLDLKVQAQADDNPNTFEATNKNISDRPRTSAISWSNVPDMAQNDKLIAEGLAPLAQQLVNRDGWQSGNSMVFLISSVSGNKYREVESYDGESANAPKLRIQYTTNSTDEEPIVITAREKIRDVVAAIQWDPGTPIVDAYYEATRYMRGDTVDYGKKRGASSTGRKKLRVSTPDSYTGGTVYRHANCTDEDLDSEYCQSEQINGNPTYVSPMISSCQTNYIVLLSDGTATSNSSANKIKALVGNSNCTARSNNDETCGVELADWLDNTDHKTALNGSQNISTYTIGFNFSSSFLEDLAIAGGGSYFTANSSADLLNAFGSILGDVLAIDTNFVAPGASVNQFNRLTHRNDIYFALFKPGQRPTWTGNLKRYEVGEDAATQKITIKDVTGAPAIDPAGGFFYDSSRSWWLEPGKENDGNNVNLGGAANKLEFDSGTRQIFTYLGDYDTIPAEGIDLSAPAQLLSETNTNITAAHLGLNSSTANIQEHRQALLKWARGLDEKDEDEDGEKDEWRRHMGDPMHSRPVILNYATAGADTDTSIFVGTNEGYLHSFEHEHGNELYSYVPKELLSNFDTYWDNQLSDAHPYGLDGSLSVWTTDDNDNVIIDPGDKAYLYAGMRRGGGNYYALDVADRLTPRLAWVIEAGQAGFEELGQTWSKMSPTKIRFNGEERDVLGFGAGYDENQDWSVYPNKQTIPQSVDSKGRGIYIVDAVTGERLYAALGSDTGDQQFYHMDYSMPGDLRIIDADYDGFADQIYASDTGGRLWRFDFKPFHESGDLLTGGILADLGGTSAADERRFYYEPDVAIISDAGDRFLSISIGSGWRAHPLDQTTDDRFYMIKSPHLFNAPAGYGKSNDGGVTYTPITEADLVDVTNELNPPQNNFGWKFDLEATGEKVLGNSITANNQVIFTTYHPQLAVAACATAIGGGSVYALSVLDGSPSIDMNGDGTIDEKDRAKELTNEGIPPSPAVLITENGPTLLVGPEQPFEPEWSNLTNRTFWVDKGDAQD